MAALAKSSKYNDHLLENQRLRFQYNITESPTRRVFQAAAKRPGKTGNELIEDLETRLDAVVLRAGFAKRSTRRGSLLCIGTSS